jgi:acyl-coenzyme A synthetase/AMP-(fatty) acid ligase
MIYVGRGDDVFNRSGYRISPFGLESVLLEQPPMAEAAVVRSPDPTGRLCQRCLARRRKGWRSI